MKNHLLTAFALIALSLASTASAQTNHAELLRKMPQDLLDHSGGAYPDPNGLVGYNRDGFKASAFQRGATLKLAIAAARGDKTRAEDCWRAVDMAFAHQKAEGHFDDPPSSVAFWLCELNRALLVVRQSPLADTFKERIGALLPKIRRATDWLAGQRDVLFKEDSHAPNRLFFNAEAFLFAGRLLDDKKFVALGREFLDGGMKLYRDSDGAFLEHGGGDSSYQAVCLLRLQEIVIHFPDPRIEAAIRKAVTWELTRIAPDGTVSTEANTHVKPGGEKFMGKEKQVNVGEISFALLYHHARTGDSAALAAVERMHRHYQPQR